MNAIQAQEMNKNGNYIYIYKYIKFHSYGHWDI